MRKGAPGTSGQVVVLGIFYSRVWIALGQGPTVFAVDADGGCLRSSISTRDENNPNLQTV